MKSGRRCRATSEALGIDGLIAAVVFALFLDIRWQGHESDFIKRFKKYARIVELHIPNAFIFDFAASGAQNAFFENDDGAFLDCFGISGQALPRIFFDFAEE